jgi:hypothetical protein
MRVVAVSCRVRGYYVVYRKAGEERAAKIGAPALGPRLYRDRAITFLLPTSVFSHPSLCGDMIRTKQSTGSSSKARSSFWTGVIVRGPESLREMRGIGVRYVGRYQVERDE